MPTLNINLIRRPTSHRSRKWIGSIGAILVALFLLLGGLRLSHTDRPFSRKAVLPPPPARPTPCETGSPTPSAEASTNAPATPASTPVAQSTPAPAPPQPALPSTALLRSVRPVSSADSTAIELQLDRPVEFTAAALHNPERVFLDLQGTDVTSKLGSEPVDVSDARVERVRIGRHDSTTRVVLDLKCRCVFDYKKSSQPPYSVVVAVKAP